jgi:hypothetical protein
MTDNPPIHAGQVLTGSLFNKPMRVVTLGSSDTDTRMASPVAHLPMKESLPIEGRYKRSECFAEACVCD